MLIYNVIKIASNIMITAPWRYGKSLNISMLKMFFSINPDIQNFYETDSKK